MVKKILIDTNVWLIFFLQREKERFEWSKKLIELVEEGKVKPYTSAILLLEINYVLLKIYGLSLSKTDKIIKGILETRNLVVINKTDFKRAFKWHKKYNVKLPDCLISSSLSEDCCLTTWDKELKRLKFLQIKSLKEVIEKLS